MYSGRAAYLLQAWVEGDERANEYTEVEQVKRLREVALCRMKDIVSVHVYEGFYREDSSEDEVSCVELLCEGALWRQVRRIKGEHHA